MIDLVFYSVVEVATAFAPGYRSFPGSCARCSESAWAANGAWARRSPWRSGLLPAFAAWISGILQQGYAMGNLLAALCFFFLFNRWGWRPMFLLGGLPALLAIFVRMRVKESEVWQKTRTHDWAVNCGNRSFPTGSSFSTSFC